MIDTITATKAKNNFGELIRRVYTTGEPVIVEKDGIAVVVVIPRVQFHGDQKSLTYRISAEPASSSDTVSIQEKRSKSKMS